MTAFLSCGAIYFGAIGGLGALLAKHISAASVVAYDDLGPEALYALEIAAFSVVVTSTGRQKFPRHGASRLEEAVNAQGASAVNCYKWPTNSPSLPLWMPILRML